MTLGIICCIYRLDVLHIQKANLVQPQITIQTKKTINLNKQHNNIKLFIYFFFNFKTEMKAQLKRLDEILTNEVQTRKGLDMTLQGNINLSSRVEDNMKRLEMFRMEDQKVLALLMTQVKIIEQRLLIGQKDMAEKRDMDMNQ